MTPEILKIGSAVFAVMFAAAAPVLGWMTNSQRKNSAKTIGLDLYRGATIFPLGVVALSLIWTDWLTVVADTNPILLCIGAAHAALFIFEDWYENW